ncbi:MAG: hypothetical protein LBQ28_00720 [Prevotellaceae bacterium]|jgi:hypothetical protein|nr:hypothetical protein [Prevotellaceae bacterium]
MKKFMFILAATVIVASTLITLTSMVSINDSKGTVIEQNESSDCYCPSCNVKLGGGYYYEDELKTCNSCGGSGLRNCKKWQACSPCRGTGCKDGYTTDNGKYCAYGHCGSCSGKGGRYVMKKECDCSSCSGKGQWYEKKQHFTGYMCPRCKTVYSPCN